jgi:LmbE family N-acetylglucosaminyl deacetylase
VTRVLVIAAHPDDEVLGMGGAIAVHTGRGDVVRVLVVTDGSSTQYPGDAETRARKEDEAVRAAEELGVKDYVHLDLPDMRLDTLAHVEVNAVVEEHVRELPRGGVHASAGREPRPPSSLRLGGRRDPTDAGQPVRRLTYAPTSSTEWTPAATNWFVPNWYVDITETLERKVAAFAQYETELREYPHPRSERAIRAAASFHGSSCGCEYAEPFVLVRGLEPTS